VRYFEGALHQENIVQVILYQQDGKLLRVHKSFPRNNSNLLNTGGIANRQIFTVIYFIRGRC
jgi:hypothetical protein